MNSSVNSEKPLKVLLMGLDNSGKSSILLSFREDTNLLSYFSLNPTKGVSIEKFEGIKHGMVCWDLGGQKQYRKEHLKNLEKYLNEAYKIIFVIDVQDKDRYNLALDYLQEVIHFIKKKEISIDFSIFLHKFDPNLFKIKDFKDIEEKVNIDLITQIKNIIPPEIEYDIYKTTIYTVFEKTLY